MSVYRLFPSRDTFVTSFRYREVPRTGSNLGSSEVLHVLKRQAAASASGIGLARVLMRFEHAAIAALTASGEIPSSGLAYRLRLFDARHTEEIPTSFDLEVIPVAQDWDEGAGHDAETYGDLGFANWDKAKSNVFWTTAGAAPAGSTIRNTAHFDRGHEDLDIDVTELVNAWLSGTVTNWGLMVRLSATLETNGTDYYVKKFHSRESFFPDKLPHLQVAWDDSLRDDRNNFVYDNAGTLFLYNRVRGVLTNIPAVGTGNIFLRVTNGNLSTIFWVTGSFTGRTGIYSASFTLPTGSYVTPFHDVWFKGNTWYMTGTFYPTDDFSRTNARPVQYFVCVPNLKNQYETSEVVRLDLFVRSRDYNPAVVLTASSDALGTVITKGYYSVRNDRTDEVVVPFGTGSPETTRLSYDERGNYFKFYMSSLSPGEVYRLVFLFDQDGQRQLIDGDFKFRVA